MNARLFFLPFFDDYSIRPLEVDKRISIFEALSNHIIEKTRKDLLLDVSGSS